MLNESERSDKPCVLNEIKSTELFDKYDTNHDNYLSLCEFKQLINELVDNNQITQRKAERIFTRNDLNEDHRIDKNEFDHLLKDPLFQLYLNKYCNIFIPKPQQKEEYHYFSPPRIGIIITSIIQIILFITDINNDAVLSNYFAYKSNKKLEVWRYITYIFVHNGWSHLLFNVIFQLILGFGLEIYHEPKRIIPIYFIGGLFGALGTSVFQPSVSLVGASGAVYAIITSYIATCIINFTEMWYPMIQLLIFGVFITCDVGISINYIINDPEIEYQTGYVAHISGAVAGLLAGIVCLRNFKVKRYEKTIQIIAMLLLVILVIIAIVVNFLNSIN